jgi:NAD(P)-dependent dehydrogenase (short-subunit alcohol dehydrogenase family)
MPRPVGDQVVVITGASSGIGRATALEFGRRGASVVLAARNEQALHEVQREIERQGGQAHTVLTDVALWPQVQRLAQQAVDRFGRIDTWVNNAAVTTYGTLEELEIEEVEQVIRVNLLGAIYGVKAVLPHLRRQGQGTIINVGSAESWRAVPLQAPYVAAKQGLKGLTDTVRMELKHEGLPVSVVLVMPSSVNTPLFSNARSKLGVKPQGIPPFYEPSVVAEVIAFAAEEPRRQIAVGGPGKLLTLMERLKPELVDAYMTSRGRMFQKQRSGQPDNGVDNLFAPLDGPGSTTGEFGQQSHSTSLYTRYLELHPGRQVALVGSLIAALALGRRIARKGGSGGER